MLLTQRSQVLHATAIPTLTPCARAEGSLRKYLPKVRNDELGSMAGLPWFQHGRRGSAISLGSIPTSAGSYSACTH